MTSVCYRRDGTSFPQPVSPRDTTQVVYAHPPTDQQHVASLEELRMRAICFRSAAERIEAFLATGQSADKFGQPAAEELATWAAARQLDEKELKERKKERFRAKAGTNANRP